MKTEFKSLKIGLAVALTLLPGLCGAQTLVSGVIAGETWTPANSPYVVVGDILVAGLTIQPGVQVLFQSNYVFEFAGVLTAIGAPNDPIIFAQTNGSGGWQGIFFNNSSSGSALVYCVISNSINSGVRIFKQAVPTIENCTIANNSSASGSGGGIWADVTAGDLVVQSCMIANNSSPGGSGGGVNANMENGNLIMQGCTLTNNKALSAGGGAWATVNSGALQLTDCVVSGNFVNPRAVGSSWGNTAGGGIGVNGAAIFTSCLFRNNYCVAYQTTGQATTWGGEYFAAVLGLRNFAIAHLLPTQ